MSAARNRYVWEAFGVERRSDAVYPFASKDNHGAVRFHKTRAAAARRSWNVVETRCVRVIPFRP